MSRPPREVSRPERVRSGGGPRAIADQGAAHDNLGLGLGLPYKTDRKISFVSYHTRSISMNITRAEAWQLHKAVNTAKGDLCRHRDRNPTGGA